MLHSGFDFVLFQHQGGNIARNFHIADFIALVVAQYITEWLNIMRVFCRADIKYARHHRFAAALGLRDGAVIALAHFGLEVVVAELPAQFCNILFKQVLSGLVGNDDAVVVIHAEDGVGHGVQQVIVSLHFFEHAFNLVEQSVEP